MIPLDVSGSESLTTDLLQQVRWRNGVEYPRCRSDRTVRNDSYGTFQHHLCKSCNRTFNDKAGTTFAHSKVTLRRWLFSTYAFSRLNTSFRQLQRKIGMTYKAVHRRVEHFTRAFDALCFDPVEPVKVDEVYVSTGLEDRERDSWSRLRDLSARRRDSYEGDKPPVFTTADRGAGQRYVIPAKSAGRSTVRLLLTNYREESLAICTDGFRAYDPLEDDNEFTREYVVHGGNEYTDGDVHINSCESHVSLT